MFEVENWPKLPGTFTFERRASLVPADRVLNSAETLGRETLGNAASKPASEQTEGRLKTHMMPRTAWVR